jgi:uncharacterized protein (DUF1778 family)
MATASRQLKSRRINARVSGTQEALLRRVASRRGQTLTEFIVESACSVAVIELGEEKELRLPPDQWHAFLEALDRPTGFSPELHKLLTQPSIIESANK